MMKVKYVKTGLLSLALVCTMMMPITTKAETASVKGDGFSYDKNTKELVISTNEGTVNWKKTMPREVASKEVSSIKVLPGVTVIKEGAFETCTGATKISLPEGLTTIEYRALRDLIKVTEINLPNSITTLGDVALYGNSGVYQIPTGLTTVGKGAFQGINATDAILPEGVTVIPDSCFYGADELETIVIPSKVTSIGGRALAMSKSATRNADMYSLAKTPPTLALDFKLGFTSYEPINGVRKIYVLPGSLDAYKTAWPKYKDIIEAIPSDIMKINVLQPTLDVNQTTELSTFLSIQAIDDQIFTYTVSDPSIISIDAAGVITALKPGTATITGTNPRTGFTTTATITVKGDTTTTTPGTDTPTTTPESKPSTTPGSDASKNPSTSKPSGNTIVKATGANASTSILYVGALLVVGCFVLIQKRKIEE